MPEQELLAPDERLRAHWPDDRPNTWPAPRGNVAQAATERASWLLALDDAVLPPAHPAFVAKPAPANASFTDGVPVTERVAPWFVRALWIIAGLIFVAVVTRTLLLRGERAPTAPLAPLAPEARALPQRGGELVAPGARDVPARPGSRPATAQVGTTASTRPEAPPIAVYALPDPDAPRNSRAEEARARGDVEAWLAAESRASAPLTDTVDAPPGTPPPERSGGIWEGTTIPVEALSGGLRLETPAVGRVRVRLADGEMTEGRLTAIGRGRVWIQTDAGPLVVEREHLRGLEQIAERVAPGPELPRRSRVRTAGGVFFGRVLARDGASVTLITDSGTRISVEAEEVSDADPD